jgi:multiple sugar transport system ATP-binding protein
MKSLRLEGIEKVFPGGQMAVAGIDLEVSYGEMVVLLGPSGCGKSTLLRIIAGIETPTHGRVLIDGQDVTGEPPQKRDIAMVFQNYALYPHMRVRENIAFGLRMRGYEHAEIAKRVSEVAGILGLEDLLDRRPSQLSGGQRQRVALGRAIARKAKVFLLDEPLSNLDVQLRVTTRMELARLHRKLAVPMVYVTHDQEEAMTLGDRIVVMRSGRVLQIGTPMEVYDRPATSFVAGFVGSPRMNLIDGHIEGTDQETALHLLGTSVAIGGFAGVPRAVRVGIRPEDLDVVEGSRADVLARVDVAEPLGKDLLLHAIVETSGGAPPVDLRVLSTPSSGIAPDATIGLRLRRDRLHLFDPGTEARIPRSTG